MTIFFDCQSYSTAYDFKVEWAFYGVYFLVHHYASDSFSAGLAEQTVTAALAFEMVSIFSYVTWIL
jgi:hypothetical protein